MQLHANIMATPLGAARPATPPRTEARVVAGAQAEPVRELDALRRTVATNGDTERAPASVDEYYAPAQGKEGAALLRSLRDLSERYHRERTYDSARRLMFRVVEDLDGDDVVTELYSGAEVAGVTNLRTATERGLTTEHVWPQSEGATSVARSDLHHLRPADGTLNSHRSNLPYGDVEEAEWRSPEVEGVDEASVVGTDAEGTKVFMPRASMRGDLARDQLYFFTRYHGDRPENYSNANFRVSLPTLLRWHAEDPPDEAERARNEAIFRVQGNRNPYVDRPEFVEQVGFDETLLGRTRGSARD